MNFFGIVTFPAVMFPCRRSNTGISNRHTGVAQGEAWRC